MADTGNDATPNPAQLLQLSDERDQWERLALAMRRDGYAAGHREGYAAGHREGYEQAVREWKVTAAGIGRLLGPQWGELDKRRYPPGGRLSWIRHAGDWEGTA